MKTEPIHVWTIALDSFRLQLHQLQERLADDEVERAKRFRFDKDRQRWVGTRAALRILLSRYCGAAPEEISFSYGSYGKPRLAHPETVPELHFNVSHAADLAMIAVSECGPLGIDVEEVRWLPDLTDVMKSHFASGECDAVRNLPASQQTEGFFHCWTRKEAFIKALGIGLSMPLTSFEVTVTPEQPARLLSIRNDLEKAKHWSLYRLRTPVGYVAALAVHADPNTRHSEHQLVEKPFRLDCSNASDP